MFGSFRNSEDLSKVMVEEAMNVRAAQFLLSAIREFACDPSGNGIVSGECDARYGSIVARSVVPAPLTLMLGIRHVGSAMRITSALAVVEEGRYRSLGVVIRGV